MASMEIAPIFIVVASAILLGLILMTLYRGGRVADWLAIALAILAGLGLLVFLLYAFSPAGFPAAKLPIPWRIE